MKQVLATESQEEYLRILGKGMVTIPKAWRDELGLEESSIIKAKKIGDRIIIESESKFVPTRTFRSQEIKEWLEADKLSVVEQTAGILKGNQVMLPPRKEKEAAEEVMAEETGKRSNRK